MKYNNNIDKFSMAASLQILKEQREALYNDTETSVDIHSGLYEEAPSVRSLYFQSYLVDWIGRHWGEIQNVLAAHEEYSNDEKRKITLFFAEYLLAFISKCNSRGTLSKIIIPEMLQNEKSILDEMLKISGEWEENSDRLKLQAKRNAMLFKKKIAEMKSKAQ